MQDFRNLTVWSRAHKFTLEIYRVSKAFPREEVFGLKSQIRRAASSIPTNLAEGSGRTQGEFAKFVQIALGSACEVEYQLLLCRDLKYLEPNQYGAASTELVEIKRMLTALLKRVQNDIRENSTTRTSKRAAHM